MKRLLSLLVAIVMVISVVPATFAAGDVGGTPDVGLWDVEEITNIDLTANLAAGDDNGCYYLWTAGEDGKMIVTSSAAAGYAYNIVMTKGETVVSGTSLELDVVKGDEVLIQVVATGEGFPAGSVTVKGAYYVEPAPETGVVINAQPQDFGYVVNGNATFTVDATNVVKYVWYFRKTETASWSIASSFSGYTTATLTVPVKNETYTGWQFRCRLDAADGKQTYTEVASLFPKVAEVGKITAQTNCPVVERKSAVFVVTAADAVRYQWMQSTDGGATWTALSADFNGAQSNRLTISAFDSRRNNQYKCKLWDASGAFTFSDALTLTISPNPLVAESQPQNTVVIEKKEASFTFNVTGAEVAKYQWQTSRNGTSWGNTTLPTYNQATFTLTAYKSRDGLYFRCIAMTKDGNMITSEPAQLTLAENPIVVDAQPQTVTVAPNKTATYTFKISNAVGTVKYRWYVSKDGANTWAQIGSNFGGYTDTLAIPGTTARNNWCFRCYAIDEAGNFITSGYAVLKVQ